MIIFEKFLGKRAEIPEDRRYYVKQGLWAKADGEPIACGLSEPALILAGGLNDLEWLVPEGKFIEQNEAVIFAITGKILYIDSPFKGRIHFNPVVKQRPELVLSDPYDLGWLFKVAAVENPEEDFNRLAEPWTYAESLKTSEGCKNPEGVKGGVSGMCKAVYSGIGAQKI
jgi:glycine cleavage system H lipoate-binding protein